MQVAAQTKPDLIIFVMDGSIGQAAHDQAKAFKDTVEVLDLLPTSLLPLPMPSNSSCTAWTLPGCESCVLQEWMGVKILWWHVD